MKKNNTFEAGPGMARLGQDRQGAARQGAESKPAATLTFSHFVEILKASSDLDDLQRRLKTEGGPATLREDRLRTLIKVHRHQEEQHRVKRQELEAELRRVVQIRALKAAKVERDAGCPPAFREACILEDGTRCPHYHDGECDLAVLTEAQA